MSKEQTSMEKPPLRTSKLALSSFCLFITSFVAFFLCLSCLSLARSVGSPKSSRVVDIVFPLLALTFVATIALAFILGIVSYIRVQRSNGQMKGKGFAVAGTILSFFLGFSVIEALPRIRSISHRLPCGAKLSQLGKAMLIYAVDNEDMFPTTSKWCDLLIESTYATKNDFKCDGARKGPCNFTMNKNLEGLGANIPPDMVVLFDSFPGWNQCGGPEALNLENHKDDGCNVLFADGHVSFIRADRLSELRWRAEEDSGTAKVDAMITDPNSLIAKVVETYRTMQTYTSQGKIVSEIDSQGERITMETVFSIKLKKPNLYLISWTKKVQSMPDMNQSGTVWNSGNQAYLFQERERVCVECDDDRMALICAGAGSDAASSKIPAMFLEVFDGATPFSRLIDSYLEESENVQGKPCYVLSGTSDRSKKETFWISKDNLVVVKHWHTLEHPKDTIYSSDATDAELDELLKTMEREVTNENRELLKKTIEFRGQMRGNVTETHMEIASPELSKEDFEYKVPQGTEFVEFDDYMKALEAMNANEEPE